MFAAQSTARRTAVSFLSDQPEEQSNALERQLIANADIFAAITNRLDQLKQNISNPPIFKTVIDIFLVFSKTILIT